MAGGPCSPALVKERLSTNSCVAACVGVVHERLITNGRIAEAGAVGYKCAVTNGGIVAGGVVKEGIIANSCVVIT